MQTGPRVKRRPSFLRTERTTSTYGQLIEIGGVNHDEFIPIGGFNVDKNLNSIEEVDEDRIKKVSEFKTKFIDERKWGLGNFKEDLAYRLKYFTGKSIDELNPQDWFSAISSIVKDRLLELWDETEKRVVQSNPKRVYYLSIEYLLGRAFQNNLLNLGIEKDFKEKLAEIGLELAEVSTAEKDAGLGNGGLGRLAACFLDSMASLNLPAWGYGLRYDYGIFKQDIRDGHQHEIPDYWLIHGSPFEIERKNINYEVRFYGQVETKKGLDGKLRHKWTGGEVVFARAFDNPIPGYGGKSAINLRLWKALPLDMFDFKKFNDGDFYNAESNKRFASQIRSLLYPNDNMDHGKELRLKQQYLFVSATIQDILNKYWRKNKNWDDLPDKVAIQLNDTHPALSIAELCRILVDYEGFSVKEAFETCRGVFNYTNHTVLPEALEKWKVPLMERLLPRHLQIIYELNYYFLQEVQAKFPNDNHKLSVLSVVEESQPKQIRMANLSIIASNKVNGVAALHSQLLQDYIFRDFTEFFPNKFTNVTNGVTIRRWINQANPELSALFTKWVGSDAWLMDMTLLSKLYKLEENKKFRKKWLEIKYANKVRLARWLHEKHGFNVDPNSVFDIMIKRIHEYKRQLMFTFYVIHRYLRLKEMTSAQRTKVLPKTCLIGGKAAPGYISAKKIIKLIHSVADTINNDPETSGRLKLFFVPNYNVSAAELLIPASDYNEHISCAGCEASGTSNMKFVMNGGIIIGTRDGANIEIGEEIGEENVVFFGNTVDTIEEQRQRMRTLDYKEYMPESLLQVIEEVENGRFGNDHNLSDLMNTIKNRNDYYLVGADFEAYLAAQEKADEIYADRTLFARKSIHASLRMAKFSTDRTMLDYSNHIWQIEPVEVE